MFFESLREKVCNFEKIIESLQKTTTLEEKIEHLKKEKSIQEFFQKNIFFHEMVDRLNPREQYLFFQWIALEQFSFPIKTREYLSDKIDSLLKKLDPIDRFYSCIGGILGYQLSVLKLLIEKKEQKIKKKGKKFFPPPYFDIRQNTQEIHELILKGIDASPFMAEIYPLGGAADRLHLVDEKTKKDLPAAKLRFMGFTLLEHMIRDLQAREYLYFKIYKKQISIPIAIMTSEEKDNHHQILSLFEENHWFWRNPKKVCFFTQPLVPVLSEEGKWIEKGPFSYVMKPGGHGALWKLAEDHSIFDWFKEFGCKNAIVRQINNPVAGLDRGLICLAGKGVDEGYSFGLIGCPRLKKTQEGVHVLVERVKDGRVSYFLSNVEYCDIQSLKECQSDLFVSSNTNILFVNISEIQKAVAKNPFPGALINFKEIANPKEARKKIRVARLETTMQNIADTFEDTYEGPLQDPQTRKTFVLFNDRLTSLSTTKNVYVPNKSILQTPEQCFYDYLQAMHVLLKKYCQCQVEDLCSIEEYLQKGPNFWFYYHSAFGPLFSLISQKMQRCRFYKNFELRLEIADCFLSNLTLDGSCIIQATHPLGHLNAKKQHEYSNQNGKCILKNVVIQNKGVNRKISKDFWKQPPERHESFKVSLHENAEIYIQDVTFKGSHCFEVPRNERWRISSDQKGKLNILKERIQNNRIDFEYKIIESEIVLEIKKAF